MKTYRVEWKSVDYWTHDFEANSPEEALEMAEDFNTDFFKKESYSNLEINDCEEIPHE